MIISERIFKILNDKKMTQSEFAKRVGVACSTISEWKKRKTNPSADKIMDICAVLEVTPEQLLSGRGLGEENEQGTSKEDVVITPVDWQIIEDYHGLQKAQKERLLAYVEALKELERLEEME
ncbi:MAG: helix-turn-helix transcriptional regulator [Lachnospiraceae bacterium]|nr:helix-turn-helix transcriptional regulator [Lachnospiraceae bacterium]